MHCPDSFELKGRQSNSNHHLLQPRADVQQQQKTTSDIMDLSKMWGDVMFYAQSDLFVHKTSCMAYSWLYKYLDTSNIS